MYDDYCHFEGVNCEVQWNTTALAMYMYIAI